MNFLKSFLAVVLLLAVCYCACSVFTPGLGEVGLVAGLGEVGFTPGIGESGLVAGLGEVGLVAGIGESGLL